jgi:hypothetical protein
MVHRNKTIEFGVYKDCDERVILEANLFVSVRLQ